MPNHFPGIRLWRPRLSAIATISALMIVGTTVAALPRQSSLKIVVLEGEDGVNVIDQKTAVAPLVEVRDENDLPVAGAIVTFALLGSSNNAALASGLKTVTATTDALGRATVAVSPLQAGPVQIQINAAYQGRTVGMTITQNNFPTAQAAQAAGKTPGSSTSASSSGSGSASSAGSAGGAGASGGSSAAAAGGAAAGAGGGIGATGIALTAAGIAGGAYGAKAAYDAVQANKCSSQEEALNNASQTFANNMNVNLACYDNARTQSQVNACDQQFNQSFQSFLNAASQYCSCVGSAASSDVSAEDKAMIRDLFNQLRSFGFNIGNVPSCFQ